MPWLLIGASKTLTSANRFHWRRKPVVYNSGNGWLTNWAEPLMLGQARRLLYVLVVTRITVGVNMLSGFTFGNRLYTP